MANLPRYVLDKSVLSHLNDAVQGASLKVQQLGVPKTTEQGVEQLWICSDKSGQLFSFSTLEVNDKNVLGLRSGVVYLELGPREKSALKRTRKDVSAAFARFEHALVALGAQRLENS
jgi:hypothetical protein